MVGGVLVGRGSFGKWLVIECEIFFHREWTLIGANFFRKSLSE
jgi:hypothetical protein